MYSTDPKDQAIISGQAEKDKLSAQSRVLVDAKKFTVVFRLEKNGRGGKTVTILDQLPNHETFVKELTKELFTPGVRPARYGYGRFNQNFCYTNFQKHVLIAGLAVGYKNILN